MCHGSGGTQNSKAQGAEFAQTGHCARHAALSQLLARGEGQTPPGGLKRASHPSKSKNSIHQTTDRPMPRHHRTPEPACSGNSAFICPSCFRETQAQTVHLPAAMLVLLLNGQTLQAAQGRTQLHCSTKGHGNRVGTEAQWSRHPRGPLSAHRCTCAAWTAPRPEGHQQAPDVGRAARSFATRSYRSSSHTDGCGSHLGNTDVPSPSRWPWGQRPPREENSTWREFKVHMT